MDEELTPMDGGGEDQGGAAPDAALEAEALEQGWVPKEQWHGKEDEWTDAATFVKRGKEINPILRKSLDRERKERQRLEAEMAELKGTVAEFAEYRKNLEKTIYERAMKDLKDQRRQALAAGDLVTADQVDEAIDELKAAPPKETPTKKDDPAPTVNPKVTAWMERNPWYNPKNEDMVDLANATAQRLIQIHGNDPEVVLPLVEAKVRKMFPAAFPGPSSAGMADAGGAAGASRGSSSASGKGFSTLPAEGKAQFERFWKSGIYKDMKRPDAEAAFFHEVDKYSR